MFNNLPPATKVLAIANIVIFLAQRAFGDMVFMPFALWPLGDGFMPWQLLTYGFLHGGWMHLFFNMLALVMFGAPLEYTWRTRRFTFFYLACVVGAGLCQLAVGAWMTHDGTPAYPTLGASGGVLGLILAYGMLFPNQKLMIFPIPFFIPARVGVLLIGALSLFSGMTGFMPGIAHFAHLGGMLTGWLILRYWRGQPPFGRGGRKPPQLRRVM